MKVFVTVNPGGRAFRSGFRSSPGFTLVELLVSMTVLSILILMLFSFFNQATSAWQGCEKKIDTFREARAALFYLRRDLQNMQAGGCIAFYINPPTTTLAFSGSPAPASSADMIFFISMVARDGQDSTKNKSDLCAIGYYVAYTRATDAANSLGGGAYNLHRYFKSSDDAWVDNPATPTTGLLPAFTNPANPIFQAATATRNGDEIIARNVIDFHIKPYRSDLSTVSPWPVNEKPAFFDISLKAYNYDTARKLQSAQDWTNASTLATVKLQNVQLFRTRVGIPVHP